VCTHVCMHMLILPSAYAFSVHSPCTVSRGRAPYVAPVMATGGSRARPGVPVGIPVGFGQFGKARGYPPRDLGPLCGMHGWSGMPNGGTLFTPLQAGAAPDPQPPLHPALWSGPGPWSGMQLGAMIRPLGEEIRFWSNSMASKEAPPRVYTSHRQPLPPSPRMARGSTARGSTARGSTALPPTNALMPITAGPQAALRTVVSPPKSAMALIQAPLSRLASAEGILAAPGAREAWLSHVKRQSTVRGVGRGSGVPLRATSLSSRGSKPDRLVQIVQPTLPPPSPRSYPPRSYTTATHPRVPSMHSDGLPPPNFLIQFEADRVPSVGDQPLPPRSAQHTTRAMATTRTLAALKKVDVQMY